VLVWSSPLGGYPRCRYLRRVLRDFEQGGLSRWEVEEVVTRASAAVIGVQVASGALYVCDGMLDWHDIFRPFVEAWRGVTPGGLLRYFDNNFFYRVPVFTSEPEASYLVLTPRVRRFLPLAEPSKLKVVIPGPVTFVVMAENKTRRSFEELADRVANLLAEEARRAAEAGAELVQVDEPVLSDPDASVDMARLSAELCSRIAKTAGVRTSLAVYFGIPEGRVYEALLDARVDYVSVDMVSSPARAVELLKSKGFGGHAPVLGLVDSRSILPDDVGRLVELAREVLVGYDGEVGVTTSTWLDLIPYQYSIEKTRLLGLLAELLAQKLGAQVVRGGGA
jgi:5-methyltetrahydropteroyltriglutamate--homocysteine methyltransferase